MTTRIEPTKQRVKIVEVPLTESERATMKRRRIEEAEQLLDEARAWSPPKTRVVDVYLNPGDDGYEDAPFQVSIHWSGPDNTKYKKQ